MKRLLSALLLLLASGLGACRPAAAPPSPAPGTNGAPALSAAPQQPNPQLRTLSLFLGTNEIRAELCMSLQEIRTGMMYRTNLAENAGMLFVFGQPHRAGFWMKNVTVPLSCAYIDPTGVVREIHDLEPGEEKPVEAATDQIQYVLETSRGWFQRHGISPGALVRTEFGSLAETFVRQTRRPAP